MAWVLQSILRQVNGSGRKLSVLTVGSSHTAGAGVGSFLRAHPTLKVSTKAMTRVRYDGSTVKTRGSGSVLSRTDGEHSQASRRPLSGFEMDVVCRVTCIVFLLLVVDAQDGHRMHAIMSSLLNVQIMAPWIIATDGVNSSHPYYILVFVCPSIDLRYIFRGWLHPSAWIA